MSSEVMNLFTSAKDNVSLPLVLIHILSIENFLRSKPRAGSGVVRIDPLRFLAGCRTRQLDQV